MKRSSNKKKFSGATGAVDLLSMMQNLHVNSTKKSPTASSPSNNLINKNLFFVFDWKDKKSNRLLTVEILLQGTGEKCNVEIEEETPGGQQVRA